MSRQELTASLANAFRQFRQTGMRWAYLINFALVVIGLVVNHFLPHGWVVWPAVLAIGMLVLINEAVDRNGQGIPPLLVYAAFIVAFAGWVLCAFIFSAIAPFLLFVGVPVTAIFGFITWRRETKRRELIDARRSQGLCVHCGQPVDATFGACGECGREAEPDESILSRLRSHVANRSQGEVARTREVLTPALPTVAARRKERALLERKHRSKPGQEQGQGQGKGMAQGEIKSKPGSF